MKMPVLVYRMNLPVSRSRFLLLKMPGVDLDEEQIIDYCRDKLTAYKMPKYVEFLDELPKSTVGKILRRELRGD